MYTRIKISRRWSLTFNTFRWTAKEVSPVYLTGFRKWTSDDSFNYSIVIGNFRIIFSIERLMGDCSG
jgi:hypothetical protein